MPLTGGDPYRMAHHSVILELTPEEGVSGRERPGRMCAGGIAGRAENDLAELGLPGC